MMECMGAKLVSISIVSTSMSVLFSTSINVLGLEIVERKRGSEKRGREVREGEREKEIGREGERERGGKEREWERSK